MFAGPRPLRPVFDTANGEQNDDERYWNRMKEVSVFQEPGNITSTDYLPCEPFCLASTCNNRLIVYDTSLFEPLWVYSRFKSPVYCATYRDDGSLLGTGTHDGNVHFFNVHDSKKTGGNRNPIRSYQAHNCRINALVYELSMRRFFSMADDGHLKMWDLAEAVSAKNATPVWWSAAHEDHIRSGEVFSSNSNLFVTGSYDHLVRVWDTRVESGDKSAKIMEINHTAPVEKVLLFPNDTIVASAGGTSVKFWDIRVGGKSLHTINNHHKTVTSMCFATNKTCLLTGGLDRKINAFKCDSGNFAQIKTWKAAAPILTLSMSKNDQYMVYGMSNLLSIHRRKAEDEPESEIAGAVERVGWTENGMRHREAPLFISPYSSNLKRNFTPVVKQRERGVDDSKVVELTARQLDRMHLGALDNLLRLKRYREMISTIMAKNIIKTQPEMVVAAFQQLRIRQKLYTALSGHSEEEIVPLLNFLSDNLFKSTYFDILYDVLGVFLSVYGEEELTPNTLQAIDTLKAKVAAEIEFQKRMCRSQGQLHMLLDGTTRANKKMRMDQSEDDQQKLPIITEFNPENVPTVSWEI
ncbi:U3 small nucleolar RNA-associated protein 15 like protein [Ditylenchus destructor]|uniref:U3 small nucleolar RNA-associated protein 15 homolog n=1 Tax=Ditylenchus destructor TaxID=166010 RepID=A0AAD4RAA9_9BILA|nr:U3 small nucleolar RNA-associated protein 15 like protein [Ditylenchus destructor]